MLSNLQKENLFKSWGEIADSMQCKAEVRVYDPLSSWECYIYALNPEDEDEMCCVINGFYVEAIKWRLSDLFSYYNMHGEAAEIDYEFRPREIGEIYKILKSKEDYDTARN